MRRIPFWRTKESERIPVLSERQGKGTPMNKLKAGFARVNINPPLGIAIGGYFVPRKAERILDDIEINALALEVGNASVALPIAQMSFPVTFLLRIIVLKESVTRWKLLGVVLSIAAVLLLCIAK